LVFVKDIIDTKNIRLSKDASIYEAIKGLSSFKQEALVVVDDISQKPICTFTQRDLVHVLSKNIPLDQKVREYNQKEPITINQHRTIEYALSVLVDNNIRRVVCVDDSGRFVGLASQKHMIKYMEEESFKTNLLVSNIISQKSALITIKQTSTIKKALEIMTKNQISSVVVVDNNNKAIGLFSEKELLSMMSFNMNLNIKLEELDILKLDKVKYSDPLKSVVDNMSSKDLSIVLVVDGQENPLSIITTRDIAYNIQGQYNIFLENKLKSVKTTLNYIGELIVEVCTDNNTHIIQWINEASIKRFGKTILDKAIEDVIGDKNWELIYKQVKITQKCTRKKIQVEDYYYEVICSYHFVDNKETLLLILRDVTDYENRVSCEVQKREEKEKELYLLQNVINQQSSLIIVLNKETIELSNKSFLEFFKIENINEFHKQYGTISDTFIKHPSFFYSTSKGDDWILEIKSLGEKDRVVSILDVQKIEPKAFSVQINPLIKNSNRYVITFTDITDIKQESQKYYYHATHDLLTKIYNRSYFLDHLAHEIYSSSRSKIPFSLIVFDIDHFKKINDSFGHLKGDEVLMLLSNTVKLNIRKNDLFARWGGEEFVLLLTNTIIEDAFKFAKNLKEIVRNIQIDDVDHITASFGVSEYILGDSQESIFNRADEALYRAKSFGRDRVEK
jgi:diguanylate cyclase (GGDEF)-like protein